MKKNKNNLSITIVEIPSKADDAIDGLINYHLAKTNTSPSGAQLAFVHPGPQLP